MTLLKMTQIELNSDVIRCHNLPQYGSLISSNVRSSDCRVFAAGKKKNNRETGACNLRYCSISLSSCQKR